jgi:hypothetical protein
MCRAGAAPVLWGELNLHRRGTSGPLKTRGRARKRRPIGRNRKNRLSRGTPGRCRSFPARCQGAFRGDTTRRRCAVPRPIERPSAERSCAMSDGENWRGRRTSGWRSPQVRRHVVRVRMGDAKRGTSLALRGLNGISRCVSRQSGPTEDAARGYSTSRSGVVTSCANRR